MNRQPRWLADHRSGPGLHRHPPLPYNAVLTDAVGLAMMVMLDTLRPAERLAFVLHHMFAVPFQDIAPVIGRSPDATKMLAHRARSTRVSVRR